MTVEELIEQLQRQDKSLEVVFGHDDWMEITSVNKDDNNGMQHPVIVID